jgi:hypothetical protein
VIAPPLQTARVFNEFRRTTGVLFVEAAHAGYVQFGAYPATNLSYASR